VPAKKNDRRLQTMVSLREASKRLQVNAQYIRGIADAMGITLYRAGVAVLMTEKDFLRVKAHLEKSPMAAG
jgi:hypothetical protein